MCRKGHLGYTLKTVNPDAFYHFYCKLCELLNKELSPETEAAALKLFDSIYAEFLDDRKQTAAEIRKEVMSWQQQDSGPLSAD